MKPIEGYELVNEAGEFKQLPKGIYGVKITNVVDKPENEYLEVYSDIVKGEYANYFKALTDAGLRDTSKHIRSYKTKALPFFKAFITAIEKSNPGFTWDWDEKKLIGKYAVAVFGEEEFLDSDGKVRVGTRLVEFRSLEAWKEGRIKVPELKKLSEEEKPNGMVVDSDPVLEIPDSELPF
jgi:hypothetical protein